MKVFITLLLLANLAGWGGVVWVQPEMAASRPKLPSSAFVAAQLELQFLDIASAGSLSTPAVITDIIEEVTGQNASTLDDGAEPAIELVTEAAAEMWCGISAVFQTEVEASSWLSDWRRLGGAGSVVETEVPVSSTWWVHLPPFPDESAARIVLNELQGKKIDSFYMRTGELAGGISLGVFSRKESAFLVQADLAKRGYAVSVKEILRMAKRFMITLELREKTLLEMPELQALLIRQSSGEVHEIPCR